VRKRRRSSPKASIPAWCPKFVCALQFFLDDRLPRDAWDLFLAHARHCNDCHGIAAAALEGIAGLGAIFGAINDRFGRFIRAISQATSGSGPAQQPQQQSKEEMVKKARQGKHKGPDSPDVTMCKDPI